MVNTRGLAFLAILACAACMPALPDAAGARPSVSNPASQSSGVCGTGSWRPGWLEIHHIDAGEGMATLIVSPVGRSMLVDAGEAEWDKAEGAKTVGAYVREVLGCAQLDYLVASHFHVDHVGFPGYGGIWYLQQQGFVFGRLLHRDLYRYSGVGGATLDAWRAYLGSEGGRALNPEIATVGAGQVELGGGVSFAFVAVDANGALRAGNFAADATPPDENDYSLAAVLRMGRLDYLTAGDLPGKTMVSQQGGYAYHDGETRAAPLVKDIDVYRVSHHGSNYSSNATWLAELRPRVSIIQVGDGNQNGHPTQPTVDHLLALSALYLTQHGEPGTNLRSAKVVGTVVLRTSTGIDYTVDGDAFVASDPRRVDNDGDGYFSEADPDDHAATAVPALNGGCDGTYQFCSATDP
jgi:beta-lactamase superfamily II metal-dependent hydrolase